MLTSGASGGKNLAFRKHVSIINFDLIMFLEKSEVEACRLLIIWSVVFQVNKKVETAHWHTEHAYLVHHSQNPDSFSQQQSSHCSQHENMIAKWKSTFLKNGIKEILNNVMNYINMLMTLHIVVNILQRKTSKTFNPLLRFHKF